MVRKDDKGERKPRKKKPKEAGNVKEVAVTKSLHSDLCLCSRQKCSPVPWAIYYIDEEQRGPL